MSQESISTIELEKEIQECRDTHSRLLDYSTSLNPLIIPVSEMSQPQNWSWSSEEMNILEENIVFYRRMIQSVESAKRVGPLKLPRPPKRKVQDLFNEKFGKKGKKNILTPQELHTFLKSRKVDLSKAISRSKFIFNPQSEEEIVKQLGEANKHFERHNAQGMLFSITFGDFLNKVRDWFLQEKEKGLFSETWDKWLSSRVKISIPHARKLRQLSKLLEGFPGFLNINVSINDILSKQKLIQQMLKIDEFATFWRYADNIPTENLTQSQEDMIL